MKTEKVLKKYTERGQALVEFSVVIIMILTLLAGVVDLGRAFAATSVLRDAAQEGANYGMINPATDSIIITRARTASTNGLGGPVTLSDTTAVNVDVVITGDRCANNINLVTVTVRYDQFPITMPMLGAILGRQTLHLEASETKMIMKPPCE